MKAFDSAGYKWNKIMFFPFLSFLFGQRKAVKGQSYSLYFFPFPFISVACPPASYISWENGVVYKATSSSNMYLIISALLARLRSFSFFVCSLWISICSLNNDTFVLKCYRQGAVKRFELTCWWGTIDYLTGGESISFRLLSFSVSLHLQSWY